MGRKRSRPSLQEFDEELREATIFAEKRSSKRVWDSTDGGKTPGGGSNGLGKKRKKAVAPKEDAVKRTGKKSSDGDIAALDDIFGRLKKPEQAEEKVSKKAKEERESIKPTVQVAGSKDDIFGNKKGPGRKRTEEGYAIYGEDELGLANEGGGTPLCPFDCDCCF